MNVVESPDPQAKPSHPHASSEQDEWRETQAYRSGRMRKALAAFDVPRRATPIWVAWQLLGQLTDAADPILDAAVPVVTIEGSLVPMALTRVAAPYPGRRIVRLRYRWADIEPHLHLKPLDLRDQVLRRLAEPGAVLRARMLAVRAEVEGC